MTTLSRRSLMHTLGGLAGAHLGSRVVEGRGQTPQGTPALTLTCADYVRLMPIATGDVKPEGMTLNWIRGDRNEMLRRATQDPAVDGGESSLAQHVMRIGAGDRSLVAVPVFPLRNFTARDIYVAKGSTIRPQDLNGRRLGIYNWAASGAVWYRHLARYLGQDPARISWVVGGADSTAPVATVGAWPAHVTRAPEGRSTSDLLLAKEVDAIFSPLPPARYNAIDGPIVRLMPDFRLVEQRYFKETGCYPPQHALVIRRAVWERDRSVGRRLLAAFQKADEAYHASQRLYPYGSPWLIEEIEQTEREMGARYHAHGLEANRHALDAFCESAYQDRLTPRRVTVDEIFEEFLNSL